MHLLALLPGKRLAAVRAAVARAVHVGHVAAEQQPCPEGAAAARLHTLEGLGQVRQVLGMDVVSQDARFRKGTLFLLAHSHVYTDAADRIFNT